MADSESDTDYIDTRDSNSDTEDGNSEGLYCTDSIAIDSTMISVSMYFLII